MRAQICSGLFIILLSALSGGCEKKAGLSPTAAPATGNACDLITKEEIEAVQEAKVAEAKSSSQMNSSLAISLCYYATAEPNKSVSVALTQRDPSFPAGSPKAYWEKIFGRFEDEKERDEEKKQGGRERPRGGEEESAPPKKVSGLGEEAFWAGSRVGGALYVLKGDAFIRISIGGPGDDAARLEKSKKLAAKALARL